MMSKEEILNKINKSYSPLTIECQQELLEEATILSLEKGTVLVREGQYSDKTFYIIKGCARAYYLKDGKDISDWFAFENEFISAIISFFTHKPSPHYIELLEDSILIELTRGRIETLKIEIDLYQMNCHSWSRPLRKKNETNTLPFRPDHFHFYNTSFDQSCGEYLGSRKPSSNDG